MTFGLLQIVANLYASTLKYWALVANNSRVDRLCEIVKRNLQLCCNIASLEFVPPCIEPQVQPVVPLVSLILQLFADSFYQHPTMACPIFSIKDCKSI